MRRKKDFLVVCFTRTNRFGIVIEKIVCIVDRNLLYIWSRDLGESKLWLEPRGMPKGQNTGKKEEASEHWPMRWQERLEEEWLEQWVQEWSRTREQGSTA